MLLTRDDKTFIHGLFDSLAVVIKNAFRDFFLPGSSFAIDSGSSFAITATSSVVANLNDNRGFLTIQNYGSNIIFLSLGPAATFGKGIVLIPYGYATFGRYVPDMKYTGIISAVSDTGLPSVAVTTETNIRGL
jgi:hypothetical protein